LVIFRKDEENYQMVKKLTFVITALVIIGLSSCSTTQQAATEPVKAEPSEAVINVEASVWDSGFNPAYITAVKPTFDEWSPYSAVVDYSNTVGYESGSHARDAVTKFRIKANTTKAGQFVTFYLKNLKVSNGSNTVYELGEVTDDTNTSVYFAKPENGDGVMEIAELNGEKVLKVSGTSDAKYGSKGVEVQWDISEATDFSTNDYTISFDVYIPSNK